MTRNILTIAAVISLGLFTTQSVLGAIIYGGNSYEFHHTSTTGNIFNKIPDIGISSSTLSGENIAKLAGSASQAASSSSGWLKNSAGIDVIGIIKTIGTTFVKVAGWMIDLIKGGLGKL